MISVAEALERILAPLLPLPSEQIDFSDAVGRVLTEDVLSHLTQPPNNVSAMDGYAVRFADTRPLPATLTQIGEVAAGGSFGDEIGPGEIVRIFTGGTVPKGADTVVMQENTEILEDGRVQFNETSPSQGSHIRLAGADFSKGDVGLETRHRLTPRDMGFLASMNVVDLKVTRKPKVAILATGDELVPPGQTPGPNQIVSSIPHALAAYVRQWGGEPLLLGIAEDNEASLLEKIKGAEGADLMVTIGGASVGDYDLIQKVLGKEGLEVDFWKIAMKPGKPFISGQINGMPLMGLPGNPTSALVCAILYMQPALSVLSGAEKKESQHTYEMATLQSPLPSNTKRQNYIRAYLSHDSQNNLIVEAHSRQDSSMLSVLSHSNAMVVREPDAPAASAGERVPVLRFTQSA
jgi:molybdopterin molybdotransferase